MGHPAARKVVIRGLEYPSQSAAARALGVSTSTVHSALVAGRLDGVGLGRGHGYHRDTMPVLIAGRRFRSAFEAARHFGRSTSYVYQCIAAGDPDRIARPARRPSPRAIPVTIAGLKFSSMAAASHALGYRHSGHVSQVLRRGSARQREALLGAAMRLRAEMERRGGAACAWEDAA